MAVIDDKNPLYKPTKWEVRLPDGSLSPDFPKDFVPAFGDSNNELVFDRTKMPDFSIELKGNAEFHKLFDDLEARVREHFPLLPDNAVLITTEFINKGDVIVGRNGLPVGEVIRKTHDSLVIVCGEWKNVEITIPHTEHVLFAIIPKERNI